MGCAVSAPIVRGIAAIALAGGAALVAACSSGGGGGAATDEQGVGASGTSACAAYAAPAATDLPSPHVSFSRDVLPVFAQSCTFSSCHGSAASEGRLVLRGEGVRARLLAASLRLPAMPYVTPADPSKSFLMHKLDGDACTLDAQCADGNCLDTMPKGGDPLPVEQRDVVRRWIAQGAADD